MAVAAMLGQRSFDDLGVPLAEATFCVLDLETTGGDRNNDMITEIGVVKVRGGECLATFQTLVNPGRAIPPRISVLTGLTDALVGPAPRIEAVLGSLVDFIAGAVFVGHNVGFDLAFLRAALERDGRSTISPTVVDTAALARRLVRDEVPDCRLSTLASRFRLDHRPTHRALDDALATTDLLHLLLERAAGLGVLGLDDLVALAKLAGHPQSAKLKLTSHLPRSPGVYLFCGHRDEVLYVGKATNLRQRVRSYFGSDDRRKIGPMLRETQTVRHLDLPDPLSAAVVESRLIASALPRYNRAGTRADKYCYIRLDTDSAWPRLGDRPRAGTHRNPPRPAAVADDGDARHRRDHLGVAVATVLDPARAVARPVTRRGSVRRRAARRRPMPVRRDRRQRVVRRRRANRRPDPERRSVGRRRGARDEDVAPRRPATVRGGCPRPRSPRRPARCGAPPSARRDAARGTALRGPQWRRHLGHRPGPPRRRRGRRLGGTVAPGRGAGRGRLRPTTRAPADRRGAVPRPTLRQAGRPGRRRRLHRHMVVPDRRQPGVGSSATAPSWSIRSTLV